MMFAINRVKVRVGLEASGKVEFLSEGAASAEAPRQERSCVQGATQRPLRLE